MSIFSLPTTDVCDGAIHFGDSVAKKVLRAQLIALKIQLPSRLKDFLDHLYHSDATLSCLARRKLALKLEEAARLLGLPSLADFYYTRLVRSKRNFEGAWVVPRIRLLLFTIGLSPDDRDLIEVAKESSRELGIEKLTGDPAVGSHIPRTWMKRYSEAALRKIIDQSRKHELIQIGQRMLKPWFENLFKNYDCSFIFETRFQYLKLESPASALAEAELQFASYLKIIARDDSAISLPASSGRKRKREHHSIPTAELTLKANITSSPPICPKLCSDPPRQDTENVSNCYAIRSQLGNFAPDASFNPGAAYINACTGPPVNPADYLVNSSVDPADYLVNSSVDPADYLFDSSVNPADYLFDSSVNPADYLFDSSVNPTSYLVDSSANPAYYLVNSPTSFERGGRSTFNQVLHCPTSDATSVCSPRTNVASYVNTAIPELTKSWGPAMQNPGLTVLQPQALSSTPDHGGIVTKRCWV